MHIEPPNTRLASYKDFAKHYLMIVLSILTALGLEAWIEHAHHAHAAEAASVRIDAEIRTNLGELQSSLTVDERQAKRLAAIRDSLLQDFKAQAPDAAIARHIQSLVPNGHLQLNLNWPTLRHEAWDVAVADQSASWMDRGRMQRYSAAYASQRDFTASLGMNLSMAMNGPRMIDTMTDLQAGTVQPREFLHVISQMATILDQAQQDLHALQTHLHDALPAQAGGAATSQG